MRKEALALAIFTGTIIGAGIFALPYLTIQIGVVPTVFLFILAGALVTITHLMYGEVASSTRQPHRLAGYCDIYLGRGWRNMAFVTTILGYASALLAYTIIGGNFVYAVASPVFGGAPWMYVTLFWLVGSVLIFGKGQAMAAIELWCMGIFASILCVLFATTWPTIVPTHFALFGSGNVVLSYGVILFSLTGMSIIPELFQLLSKQRRAVQGVIVAGTLASILAYGIFIASIVGILGSATQPDAFTGLERYLSGPVLAALYLFGIIAVFTSYIALAETLKTQFEYDIKLGPVLAWCLASLPPYIFYLFGFQDFISVMAFSGAVFIGIDMLFISALYLRVQTRAQRRPSYRLCLRPGAVFIVLILSLSGVVAELVRVFTQ